MEPIVRATRKDNSYRKFKGESGPRPDRAAYKRSEAKERQEKWAAMTPQEQLADLDRRLGVGVGAKKQRARLLAKIATP